MLHLFLFCDLQDLQSINQNINICPKQEEFNFLFLKMQSFHNYTVNFNRLAHNNIDKIQQQQ